MRAVIIPAAGVAKQRNNTERNGVESIPRSFERYGEARQHCFTEQHPKSVLAGVAKQRNNTERNEYCSSGATIDTYIPINLASSSSYHC
jgi:hypothetical protein